MRIVHLAAVLVVFLFFAQGIRAQPTWADSCTTGSFYGKITVARGFSIFEKVHEYSGGDLIVAGGIRSDTTSPNFTLPTVYGFLARINARGDMLWSKFIGFDKSNYGSDTRITASTLTANGDIVVVAHNAYGLTVENGGNFVVRLDGSGNPRWKKRMPFNFQNNSNYDIVETSDGGLLIGGSAGSAYSSAFVCKLDANGGLLWYHLYGNSGPFTYCRSVAESPGAYYFTGFNHEFASQATQNLLVKLDKQTGNLVWAKSFLYATQAQGQAEYSFDKMTYRNGLLTLVGGTNRMYSGSHPSAQATVTFDENGQFISGQRIEVTNVLFDPIVGYTHARFDPYAKIGVQYEYATTGDFNVFRLNNDNSTRWAWKLPAPDTDQANESLVLSDSSLAVVGTNNVPATNAVLFRTAADGKLENCTSLPTGVHVTSFSTTVSNFSLGVTPYTIDSLRVSQIAVQEGSRFSWDLTCKAPICKLSKIAGIELICAGEAAVYSVSVVGSCKGKVDFTSVGNNVIQRLTDTSVSIVFGSAGRQVVYAHLPGSCQTLVDSLIIDVQQGGKTLDLGPDQALCPGNNLLVNAHKGYVSYLWQDGSTDSTFNVTGPGLYHVTTTDACGGTYSDTVFVTVAPPIPFSIGPDRTKCNSDTLHLSAPSGFLNYQWSNNYNINSTTSRNVVVNPLKDTAYFVKAEKSPGCFAYDTVRVRVNHSPAIDLGGDKSFCIGDSAVFTAGTGFNQYLWSNGNTSQQITVTTPGTYAVTGTTVQGCKSYDTVKVLTVFANPVVRLDHNNTLCTGTSRVLDAGPFSSYKWTDGSSSRTLSVNTTGVYTVEVQDANGCKGSDTTVIAEFLPLPENFLPADTAICSYGSLTLKPTHTYTGYLWSNNASASAITITQPGEYWLKVEDINGCKGSDTMRVSLKDCMQGFYIPTAFTPDGDGKNDVFRPLLFGRVKKYSFTIYNRWGQVVFQTSELAKGWNGIFAGTKQDSNVFAWTCTYQLEGQEVKTEKGTVMLMR